MKIELLTDIYSDAQGFKLQGKGVHEVDDTKAAYLLNTFPTWFKAVKAAEPEKAPEPAKEAKPESANDEPPAQDKKGGKK